jgi:hypothetical protein
MNGLHGPLGFSGIIGMEKLDWAILGQNSNNPPSDPRGTCNFAFGSKTLFIYWYCSGGC